MKNEELLEHLEHWANYCGFKEWSDEDEQAYNQIRRLIQNPRPKVNLEHIDKLLKHFNGEVDDLGREYVIDWLNEADVKADIEIEDKNEQT